MRVTFTISTDEAVELFTVLNKDRDARYRQAADFAAIKEAFCFGEIVARLRHAYIRGVPVEVD